MAADGKTPPTHPQGGGGNIMCTCSIFVCRHKNNDMSTLLGHVYYIHTKQTINQYKQIVIIHKSIETYSYTYTWLQMVRPPQPTHRGGGGNIMCTCSDLCVQTQKQWHVDLAGTRTYLHYSPTDRQTHRHTYINQYKHIVIPIHGCICVTYPPFGGVGGNQGGLDHIYSFPMSFLFVPS